MMGKLQLNTLATRVCELSEQEKKITSEKERRRKLGFGKGGGEEQGREPHGLVILRPPFIRWGDALGNVAHRIIV